MSDLEKVRNLVNKLLDNNGLRTKNWCFVDSVTARRFFRIDVAQENVHFVLDVCDDEGLFILDEDDIDAVAMLSGPTTNGPSQMSTTNLNQPMKDFKPGSPLVRKPESPVISKMMERTTEGVLKAARLGDSQMMNNLHREGYSLLSIDETGKTALHYGARFGHKEIVKFLIGHADSAILDIVDNEKGQTALHKAAAYKRRTICCILIGAGASLLINDFSGMSPRQLALMADDSELASYLESQEQFQADKFGGDGFLNDL